MPRVKSWIKRHPRFHLHFAPTSSSWLNMVERWIRDITKKCLRRGTFKSVPSLIKAIDEYIENRNQNPKVFIWRASAKRIMEKIKSKEVLNSLHQEIRIIVSSAFKYLHSTFFTLSALAGKPIEENGLSCMGF